tara:strand:- start:353 stop:562 length:210 start_codon:yes stop_codon:yes gene_type:complete
LVSRYEKERDNQSSGKAEGFGCREKVWQVSPFFDLVAIERGSSRREEMDHYTNLQARQINNLEDYAANV